MTTTITPPSGGNPGQIVINGSAHLPLITHLDAFLARRESPDCPEQGRFAWLAGTLWVDLMTEQLFSHNQLKLAIAIGLYHWAERSQQGRYFTDGVDLLHRGSELVTVPDGMYVSYESLQIHRVRIHPARDGVGFIRLEGVPDMVLEVISDTSEEKDLVTLPGLYHAAGIGEFWRVDGREEVRFEILQHTTQGYVPSPTADGWQRSAVFVRDFRLVAETDPLGLPRYTLEHRVADETGGGA
jgi:Uma2 family endonuclease